MFYIIDTGVAWSCLPEFVLNTCEGLGLIASILNPSPNEKKKKQNYIELYRNTVFIMEHYSIGILKACFLHFEILTY